MELRDRWKIQLDKDAFISVVPHFMHLTAGHKSVILSVELMDRWKIQLDKPAFVLVVPRLMHLTRR